MTGLVVKMLTDCPGCNVQIRFPHDASLIRCPECGETFSIKGLHANPRGWRIALFGTLLTFNYFFTFPFSDGSDTLFFLFLSLVGTSVTLGGLMMSVNDKRRVGNGFYLLEAALAVVVAGHAYVIMSMGSIS
tara:strand:- start:108 stop:503 length:396 start_codon:yes stop_codon:yes gene_type:complete